MHLGYVGSYGNKEYVDTPHLLIYYYLKEYTTWHLMICFVSSPYPEGVEIGAPRDVEVLVPGTRYIGVMGYIDSGLQGAYSARIRGWEGLRTEGEGRGEDLVAQHAGQY